MEFDPNIYNEKNYTQYGLADELIEIIVDENIGE